MTTATGRVTRAYVTGEGMMTTEATTVLAATAIAVVVEAGLLMTAGGLMMIFAATASTTTTAPVTTLVRGTVMIATGLAVMVMALRTAMTTVSRARAEAVNRAWVGQIARVADRRNR